jgi:hypothetical protein
MQGRSILPLVLAVGVAVVCLVWGRGAAPTPGPGPSGPDLVRAFSTNGDRSEATLHARTFATICASLADCLEYDGSRSSPLIKTGVQIDELRRGVRQTRMRGWSFVAKYPDLGPAVDAFLTAELGTSGGPLAPEQRSKWIAAMRQLAAAAEYAAQRG